MDPVYVAALGRAAPGLEGWRSARRVLAGETPYVTGDVAPYRPARVPANERRRLTATMRLALQVADDAGSAGYAGAMRAVFATSGGELQTTARICEALCVSPESFSRTQFHNSVQNAPAGYWAIANGSLAASTTISAFEATFAAGLLEAAVQVQVERVPVLLVAYDHPAPPPWATSCRFARRSRWRWCSHPTRSGLTGRFGPVCNSLSTMSLLRTLSHSHRLNPCASVTRPRAVCRCSRHWRKTPAAPS